MEANISSDTNETVFDVNEISNILPHRYPFLLVDRITYMNLDENIIIGQKNVTTNEQFFQGHFPGMPIMPGVLVLEALAQTGGILVHQKGCKDKMAVLLYVDQAKFRRPIVPGDVLVLKVKGVHFSSKGGKIKAEAFVDGHMAVQADMGFALKEK